MGQLTTMQIKPRTRGFKMLEGFDITLDIVEENMERGEVTLSEVALLQRIVDQIEEARNEFLHNRNKTQ